MPIERPSSSGDSSATTVRQGRSTFTRSRSPAVVRSSLTSKTSHSHRLLSPAFSRLARPKFSLLDPVPVLPSDVQLHIRIPFTTLTWALVLPVPRFIEGILLLGSLFFAISRFPPFPVPKHPALSVNDSSEWISSGNVANYFTVTCNQHFKTELYLLGAIAFIYLLWSHSTLSSSDPAVSLRTADSDPAIHCNIQARPVSPRVFDARDGKRNPSLSHRQFKISYMWMSVPKNYR